MSKKYQMIIVEFENYIRFISDLSQGVGFDLQGVTVCFESTDFMLTKDVHIYVHIVEINL